MASDIVQDKDIKEQSQLLHDNAEAPRNALIDTAVKFLQNPKVKNSPMSQKQMFLESKGLTPSEISLAIEKSGVAHKVVTMPSSEVRPFYYSHPRQPPVMLPSKWTKLRDICSTVALVCGAVYGLYHFSKKCILPYMLGLPSEEEKLAVIEKEMKEFQITTAKSLLLLQNTLLELQTTLHQLHEKQDTFITSQRIPKSIEAQFTDLRSEVTSLKGLLLSRHQFPAIPAINPVIPTWQMRNDAEANGDVGHDHGQTHFIDELNAANGTENDIPSV